MGHHEVALLAVIKNGKESNKLLIYATTGKLTHADWCKQRPYTPQIWTESNRSISIVQRDENFPFIFCLLRFYPGQKTSQTVQLETMESRQCL